VQDGPWREEPQTNLCGSFFKLASASCAIPTREQAMQDFKAQWLETLLGRDAKGSVL
jgi:hypothetical protein